MDWVASRCFDRAEVVHRLSNHVNDSSQGFPTHSNGYRPTEINGLHAPDHSISRLHRNCANASLAQMLLNFKNDVYRRWNIEAIANHAKRLIDRRHGGLCELHVHCGTGDLNNVSDVFWHKTSVLSIQQSARSIQP